MSNLLYAPAIHQATAGGDLKEMKTLAEHAEEHLEEHGDIKSALKLLQAEIARLEKQENQ